MSEVPDLSMCQKAVLASVHRAECLKGYRGVHLDAVIVVARTEFTHRQWSVRQTVDALDRLGLLCTDGRLIYTSDRGESVVEGAGGWSDLLAEAEAAYQTRAARRLTAYEDVMGGAS